MIVLEPRGPGGPEIEASRGVRGLRKLKKMKKESLKVPLLELLVWTQAEGVM